MGKYRSSCRDVFFSVWWFLMSLAFLRTAEGICHFLWSGHTHTASFVPPFRNTVDRKWPVAIELKLLVRAGLAGCPNLLLNFTVL